MNDLYAPYNDTPTACNLDSTTLKNCRNIVIYRPITTMHFQGRLGSKIRARHYEWVRQIKSIKDYRNHPVMNFPDYHWTSRVSPPGSLHLLGPLRSIGPTVKVRHTNQLTYKKTIHSKHQIKLFFGDLRTIQVFSRMCLAPQQ